MHESLHKLEGLIRLLPVKTSLEQTSLSEIKALLEEALLEKETVRKALLDSLLTMTEDKALRTLVRCYQDGLIRLSDEVYKSQQAHGVAHAQVYDPLISALGRLLIFLKEDFGEHTNPEKKIPDVDRVRVQLSLRERWTRVAGGLPLPGDKPFRDQLDRWFSVLLDGKYTPLLSERQYIYHRVLMNEFLDRIPEETEAGRIEAGPVKESEVAEAYPLFTPLVECLVYMDFNHPAILRHLVDAWSRGIKRLYRVEDRLARIRYWQALLAKLPVQKMYALYPEKRSIRDQLEQWLDNQLEYAMYKLEKPREYPGPGEAQGTAGVELREAYEEYENGVAVAEKATKLHLTVSVAALGLFVRLLMEHQVIGEGVPQTEVIQFVTRHFATVRQPVISTASMLGSYHKPLQSTVVMVRKCLRDWDKMASKWI